jgi:hypothetical protein
MPKENVGRAQYHPLSGDHADLMGWTAPAPR